MHTISEVDRYKLMDQIRSLKELAVDIAIGEPDLDKDYILRQSLIREVVRLELDLKEMFDEDAQ